MKKLYHAYHPIVWTLLLGTVFARGASFAAMPFLALYLSKTTDISPLLIGITIGIGPLTGTVGGFIGGHLSDRYGRKVVMLSTIFVWSFVFIGFALSTHVIAFMILNAVNGLSRSFFEPTSQALMSDVTEKQKRLKVFAMRYTAINIGAAVGPLLGAYLGMISANLTFFITGAIYFMYGIALLLLMNKYKIRNMNVGKAVVTVKAAFQVISKDVSLRYFLIGGILVNIGYSQIESSLPQHLEFTIIDGVILYSVLLSVNAVTVVILQIPLSKWVENWKTMNVMMLGAILFTAGFIGFGISTGWMGFIISMLIITVGEIFLFPSGSVFIDKIAPEQLRGTYFGATQFRSIGHSAGPIFGGWILSQYNGHMLFIIIGCIVASSIIFYYYGNARYEKSLQENNAQTAS
jgi:MFS family permease